MAASVVMAAPGIDFRLTLAPLVMLTGDPTIRLDPTTVMRATFTPEGPGAIRAQWHPERSEIELTSYGDGKSWLMERGPGLVGAIDDASSFEPRDPVVARLWAHFRGDRVARTGTFWHDAAWTIVQQRVHRRDAAAQWRRIVLDMGTRVSEVDDLWAPPDPQRVARSHPTELRRYGIDTHRAQALIHVAIVANRLQALVDGPFEEARRPLLSIGGIGPWTVSCLSAFTWGDPDTVIVGDSGIPSLLASTLVGERRATEERMLELLEPYRPHRYRVLKLAFAARTRRHVS